MLFFGNSIFITDSTFDHNLESLYIFNGFLPISGHTKFENCEEPSNKSSMPLSLSTMFPTTVSIATGLACYCL